MHNDAMYDSALNPRRSYWKSVDFDVFDPLTYLIEESHKRGIEFHAWLNPYRVVSSGHEGSLESYATNFRNTYPEFPNNPAGDVSMLVKSGASGIYMNPGEPKVREHMTRLRKSFKNTMSMQFILTTIFTTILATPKIMLPIINQTTIRLA